MGCIRFATAADSAALLKIYRQYMDTPITFEYDVPDGQTFAARIAAILTEYPYLVYEQAGQVIGYAYAHRAQERAAYQWNAELSVYLDQAATSRGIGTALYRALMELLKLQRVKTAYGCVTVPNEKSERLHLGMGFRRIGIYRSAGYKCGCWQDVCWFEKQIAPYDAKPEPIRPIGKIPAEQIEAVLQKYRG